ncbi:PREDICTED: F-box protein SKIP23-like [Camelina sativa]|uniref:F-box protein SKIP23-like n=1 Tax=Camelina sativa TaxID=90675 RepID=A0ABM0XST5_CAMSA|nr:PREDICTED: F-box protein SKIP23-like [Camelina sativa]
MTTTCQPSSCHFCDVILFNGCFFAVEKNGRTFSLHLSSLRLTLAANPVFGDAYDGDGDKKFLIESSSGGDMLLVDMISRQLDLDDLSDFEYDDVEDHGNAIATTDITLKIRVFRFVQRDQSWVQVKDLGDRMLFLADSSTFSASASDTLPLYGASVFFHGFIFNGTDLGSIGDKDVAVCDFRSQKMKLVRQHPQYANLFWPPPSWIIDKIPSPIPPEKIPSPIPPEKKRPSVGLVPVRRSARRRSQNKKYLD